MHILTISDLHGRSDWKEVDIEAHDRVIFLGDYTDSYDEDDDTIYANLKAIIECKEQYPDKVVLLIGNHDAQYMHFPHYRCSGFRPRAQRALSNLFRQHNLLFRMAHQQGAQLFTHAGVTNKWLRHLLVQLGQDSQEVTPDYDLAGLLNEVHQQAPRFRNVLFEASSVRGGSDAHSGPVWADRSETRRDYLSGFHQVVGHTPVTDFTTVKGPAGSITYTDVLRTKTAFYEITIPD